MSQGGGNANRRRSGERRAPNVTTHNRQMRKCLATCMTYDPGGTVHDVGCPVEKPMRSGTDRRTGSERERVEQRGVLRDAGEVASDNPTVADGLSAGEVATALPGEAVDKPVQSPAPTPEAAGTTGTLVERLALIVCAIRSPGSSRGALDYSRLVTSRDRQIAEELLTILRTEADR